MIVVYVLCSVALGLAGLLALVRIERGPSMLDRAVGLDVVTAATLGSVALVTAVTDRTDLVPVLLVLAVVGFVGAVTLARFVAVDRAEEARILTREELRAVLAQQRASDDDEAPPVHDPDAPAATATAPTAPDRADMTEDGTVNATGGGEGTAPLPAEETPEGDVGHDGRQER
ncbi:monovalent cation/H+ antiporter complex subunit F [Georgenia muralis]|uniref:Multicomponent Na+:H+ antiporter subunit F n=1 Tax=Georgenia muralis TaxID=154117 RepID=A0A3N4Z1R8_9MICO|nr:monovalent cation/H+ antiporter complex subunit F [Georgenia muralis]RPF26547.1 multicomponent Na+:H+ antiporter subunit F [Georgenia muralis]